MKKLILLMAAVAMFSGCAANMAMNGKNGPDMKVVKHQESRQEVERLLGSPVEVTELKNGHVICRYVYEAKIDPDYIRAAGHATADLFTFGLWELVGTPIEGYVARKRKASVEYDESGKIVKVNDDV